MDQRTPRRLGLSRIVTPKNKQTPQLKRTNEATNAEQTISTVNEDTENMLVTPAKKKKTSFGRIDFISKELTNDSNEKNHQTDQCVSKKTADELKAEIQQMKDHLEKYEKYKSEKNELENLIETWRVGGIQALRQLQTQIQPKQDIKNILEHFKLPTDIFGNIAE